MPSPVALRGATYRVADLFSGAGGLSLGFHAKIAVSIGAFLVAVYFLLYSGSHCSGLVIFAVLPLFFRDVWRRRRIR